jgi:hypothetical protein
MNIIHFIFIFFVKLRTDNGLSLCPLFFRLRLNSPRLLLSEKEPLQDGALSRRGWDVDGFSPESEKWVGICGCPKRELPLRVFDKFCSYVVKAYLKLPG